MHGISGAGREELTTIIGRGRRLVTVADVTAALSVSDSDAAKRLARWANLGWLRRVRRGLYIPVPIDAENPAEWTDDPLFLADAVWDPCYFTGWTTANHWGLTEQVFRTTVVRTARRVRRSAERLAGHEYLVSHTDEAEMTWGMATEWRHDRRLSLADPARTVVDVLADLRLGGGIRLASEILANYLLDQPGSKLIEYGDRLRNGGIFKRLGFLVEVMGVDEPEIVKACERRKTAGLLLLDPTLPTGGRRSTKWGLRINAAVQFEGAS